MSKGDHLDINVQDFISEMLSLFTKYHMMLVYRRAHNRFDIVNFEKEDVDRIWKANDERYRDNE